MLITLHDQVGNRTKGLFSLAYILYATILEDCVSTPFCVIVWTLTHDHIVVSCPAFSPWRLRRLYYGG